MSLVVMKFGGTSVGDDARVRNAARIAMAGSAAGDDIVVVVSAQGDTTDELIEKAHALNARASRREMDMLLSTGEQMSASLLAMTIEALGGHAVSLNGWQAGLQTDSVHSSARIRRIDGERIRAELDARRVVVVTGFQGVDRLGDITTLGRGGSDTSAVAVAAALKADVCKIYTDVDGVYTADPRKVKGAVKLDEIGYDEMLELASLGAQVILNRAVELAQKYNIQLEILSSLTGHPGTVIKEAAAVEGMMIKGVTKDTSFCAVSVLGLPDRPGAAFKVFSLLNAKDINVDVILQSVPTDGRRDLTFTVASDDAEATLEALRESRALETAAVAVDADVAKVSIVGAGMISHPGVAMRMFKALADAGINIKMISTSEIKISVILGRKDADAAVQAVHDEFIK
ncbi:MAG: aspartate kinase [Oscillospiraceae bacterium]|nr:aspartate kinase [Oscillospiraceae bacterium]